MSNQSRIIVISSRRGRKRVLPTLTFKAAELIWLLFGMLEAAIALGMVLKLIGANPASPMVAMIYGFTHWFLIPFTGMVDSPTVGNMEFELSPLFAMLIYALIAWVLERIVWLIFYRSRGPVVAITQTKVQENPTFHKPI